MKYAIYQAFEQNIEYDSIREQSFKKQKEPHSIPAVNDGNVHNLIPPIGEGLIVLVSQEQASRTADDYGDDYALIVVETLVRYSNLRKPSIPSSREFGLEGHSAS